MSPDELTINDLLRFLFPSGTNLREESQETVADKWRKVPQWPPDLFAFCAKAIELCDSYTELINSESNLYFISSIQSNIDLQEISNYWATEKKIHSELEFLWTTIIKSADSTLKSWRGTDWIIAIHSLLVIADEASSGVGFFSNHNNWIQEFYQKINGASPQASYNDRPRPTSCLMVPQSTCCVQPKTRTPQVGCTVRSLSHHLSLLPPSSSVHVSWHPTDALWETSSILDEDTFNLIVIPFPYYMSAKSICGEFDSRGTGYFEFDLSWVEGKEKSVVEKICDLIKNAKDDAGAVNGVILPELALNEEAYSLLVEELKTLDFNGLQFLVAGVKLLGRKRNAACTTVFADRIDGERILYNGIQYKHHRWRLDRSQISTYALGSKLNQEKIWWENINIGSRSLDFYPFRKGSCFSTLICEDLARVDPCQPVLRSVGPNLVIALLMDGPQLMERWPGRYAMNLADDPGSSVLSLTSTALMRRSAHRFGGREVIALWRDPYGETMEVEMPKGSDAMLLTLARFEEEERTLDGRGDGGAAYAWRLSGTIPVK